MGGDTDTESGPSGWYTKDEYVRSVGQMGAAAGKSQGWSQRSGEAGRNIDSYFCGAESLCSNWVENYGEVFETAFNEAYSQSVAPAAGTLESSYIDLDIITLFQGGAALKAIFKKSMTSAVSRARSASNILPATKLSSKASQMKLD